MTQFYTGEAKTAKVIMRNPTAKGFDYQGALIIGLPEAARSEVSFFIPASGEKLVSFPVAMPSVAGAYPVYLHVTAEGKEVGLYDAGSITVTNPILDLGRIDILSINDWPFVEVGVDPDGVPYGMLETPFQVSRLGGFTVHFYNKEVTLQQDNFVDFIFYLRYRPAWDAGYPCSWPPAYRGWAGCQPVCDYPGGCPPGFLRLLPPFEATCNVNSLFGDGYWCVGLYHGEFEWALRYFDQPLGPVQGRFRVKNLVYCDSAGGPVWG